MEVPAFEVKLNEFSGPFDVLLDLITKKRLDLTDLALLEVTNEFVDYVSKLEQRYFLPRTSEFLVIASTLLANKTARLLPGGEDQQVWDSEIVEAKNLLLAKLIQYKAFKDISNDLHNRLTRTQVISPIKIFFDHHQRSVKFPPQFSVNLLPDIYTKLCLNQLISVPSLKPLILDTVTVARSAHKIAQMFRTKKSLYFSDLFASSQLSLASGRTAEPADLEVKSKETEKNSDLIADHQSSAPSSVSQLEAVATFLAVLELFRHNLIELEQLNNFQPIQLTRRVSAEILLERVTKTFDDKIEQEYHG
ncbi:MAG: segregation/condensation protein A [Bifidobacteriaceae bacterium]|jgi:segregation and condensation protein A|nr:segregation/condensation protein A [Bifidobacteriaceae bacterium]